MVNFAYADESQQWFQHIFADHLEEARSRAFTLVERGGADGYGLYWDAYTGCEKGSVQGQSDACLPLHLLDPERGGGGIR